MLLKYYIVVLFVGAVYSQGVAEKGSLDDLIKDVFPQNPNGDGTRTDVVNEKVRRLVNDFFAS